VVASGLHEVARLYGSQAANHEAGIDSIYLKLLQDESSYVLGSAVENLDKIFTLILPPFETQEEAKVSEEFLMPIRKPKPRRKNSSQATDPTVGPVTPMKILNKVLKAEENM